MSTTASRLFSVRIGPSFAALLLWIPLLVFAGQPMEVLRESVESAIRVLEDPRYRDAEQEHAQQEALCKIAKQMFDSDLFSRLVLESNWSRFDAQQKVEFTDVFTTFLCRFYLSRLQRQYSDEKVVFKNEHFMSDSNVSVRAEVLWKGLAIPVEVRMTYRDGAWRAYDLIGAGISAVMLYRAQFRAILPRESPSQVIESIRARIEAPG